MHRNGVVRLFSVGGQCCDVAVFDELQHAYVAAETLRFAVVRITLMQLKVNFKYLIV